MKVYVFLDDNENVIERVVAENHDDAVDKANGWKTEGELVTSNTDFYSEDL